MMSINETFEDLFRKRFGRPPTKEEMTILIDQSVKSYNQSGGITAHTVNLGPQPRKINSKLQDIILTSLPRDQKIRIVAVMGDAEALQLAFEILEFMKRSGFNVEGPHQAMYTEPVKGLVFNDSTNTLIVGANLK